jgi:hypothetical protein
MRRISAPIRWGGDPPRIHFSLLLSAALLFALLALPRFAGAQQQMLDYGDAPAPYPTLFSQNGARHTIIDGVHLGQRVDGESDGQPNATATGDDINPPTVPSDEDGVTFLTALVRGQTASIRVIASTTGRLDAWIDWNANGSWADTGDRIAMSLPLVAGANTLNVNVPSNAQPGFTFARFRFSRQGGLSFTGAAPDGEVEDYRVQISEPEVPMDFGDAPDPSYPTLLRSNGARHRIVQGIFLGERVDAEPDGQPNPTATGDDSSPAGAPSDEDGVTFLSPLTPGQTATIRVVASVQGRLDAWLDFAGNGQWSDPGDQIFTSAQLAAGENILDFEVPCSAKGGPTFARFRFSLQGGLSFTGEAPNGEVEDYRVQIADSPGLKIQCPRDMIVAATGPEGAVVDFEAIASNSCDPNLRIICDPPSGSLFPIGKSFVSCTVTDGAGNSDTCRFTVTVVAQACCESRGWTPVVQQGPGTRQGHSMAFDSARGRLVLFGGNNGQIMGDTWEWDGNGWTLAATTGPAPRQFTAMAYDSQRGRTVLFGGFGPNGAMLDTWEWDGMRWRPIQVEGPGPRYAHAMAYDSARGQTVLFGGQFQSPLDDTWEYDGGKWVLKSPNDSAPLPRAAHAMAYDSLNRRTVLFGGVAAGVVSDDTWQWNGERWERAAEGGPSERAFHAMAYDSGCSRVVMFGGGTVDAAGNTVPRDDTWEWDGTKWTFAADKLPQARMYHAMAYDSARGQTLMYGGSLGQNRDGDMWAWSNGAGEPPRVESIQADCQDNQVTVVFSRELSNSALDPSHYIILAGNLNITIISVQFGPDRRTIIISTQQPLAANTGYVLSVSGVEDLCGNPLDSERVDFSCTFDPCPEGSAGTEFWLTFPGNYAPDPANQPQPRLFIAGEPGTTVTVTMSAIAPPFMANVVIPAGGMSTVTLPRSADLANANDVIENKGVRVVASNKVTVYGHNHVRYTTDAYLGLSTAALGRAYVILSYQNVFNSVPELNGVQFAIVATTDNTTVAIVPSVTTGAHPAGVPYFITMNRGQTYQLRNTESAPNDLSGTIILADQPIAVFGSHQCANLPGPAVFFCDYIVEQLFPTRWWGNNFVTVPLQSRSKGDTFRFMAMMNGTTVNVNGVPIAGSLNLGQFHELLITNRAHITSSHPILVAQYANSSDYDGVLAADPFMVLIPSTPMFQSSYTVMTPTTGFTNNFINVVAPSAAVGQVMLDGAAIPAGLFSSIGSSGFSGAQVPVGTGVHRLHTLNNVPFGVVVYGWSLFDSYGYPGGGCSPRQVPPPQVSCPPETLSGDVGRDCQGEIPDMRQYIPSNNTVLLVTQTPAAGTKVSAGNHTIVTTLYDQYGQTRQCTTLLTIHEGNMPAFQCPPDITTNCVSDAGTVVFFEPVVCDPTVQVICEPPSGSVFPVGETQVICRIPGQPNSVCSFIITVRCQKVAVTRSPTHLPVLSWSDGGTLESADNLNGPWVAVANARSPFTVQPTGSRKFFRVRY